MSATDWAIIITAVTGLVSAVCSGTAVVLTAIIHSNVRKVELATNSMKDALVKSTGEAAFSKGLTQGRADQKAETSNPSPPHD